MSNKENQKALDSSIVNRDEVESTTPMMEVDHATYPSASSTWHKAAWRMDPKHSYSDWTIEIVTPSHLTSFQVHKFFMAVGPRKSLYFDRLFQSKMKESATQKTCLTLEPSAANAFPAFLDFIYTGEVHLTPSSAVALGYLGDYFGVADLLPLSEAFIHKDIQESRAHVHIYCQEAILYKNTKLVETLMKTVATLSHDDLLRQDECPVSEMMSLLSLEQRNQVYLEALRVAHGEMARLKPVKDFYTGVFSNVSFRAELTPSLLQCLERGGAARSTHGQTWMPLFYYDGRA